MFKPNFLTFLYFKNVKTRFSSYSTSASSRYDVVVIGGGIIGAATARELATRHRRLKLCILEKESKLGAHQSGHNSGVLHTGIYYVPGSLKAKLCTQGIKLAYEYCDAHNIPYKKCGKLIVAVENKEIQHLDKLYQRGLQNGIDNLQLLSKKEIKNIEPNCKGLKAIWSPETGIVDWGLVTQSLGDEFKQRGGEIKLNFEVKEFKMSSEDKEGSKYPLKISNGKEIVSCKFAISCAGLYSDKIATLTLGNPFPKIVPFRGEYLLLKPEKANLVKGNIYPVPDPNLPFLGVHYTPRMDGQVWLGPNAVLSLKREGYKATDFSLKETCEMVKFRGLRKLIFKNLKYGVSEAYRGINIAAQVRQLQRYVPSLKLEDVTRGPTGVRAQAMDDEGNLVDDFVFDTGEGLYKNRVIHLRNAPSPGATSSLAIAKIVADKFKNTFEI